MPGRFKLFYFQYNRRPQQWDFLFDINNSAFEAQHFFCIDIIFPINGKIKQEVQCLTGCIFSYLNNSGIVKRKLVEYHIQD